MNLNLIIKTNRLLMRQIEPSDGEFFYKIKKEKYVPESFFGMTKAYQKLRQIEKAKENILKTESSMDYKINDVYNEFLNEIYIFEKNLNNN